MSANAQATLLQFLPLIILVAVMYFLMIRPQRKKDKAINDMRRGLTVGDEIVTIGGIVGKIVKTKDETIVVQVGADKVMMEMMRWAVSSVTLPSGNSAWLLPTCLGNVLKTSQRKGTGLPIHLS